MFSNPVYMQHPIHGVHPMYTEAEIASAKNRGWSQIDGRTKEARTLKLRKPDGHSTGPDRESTETE